MLAPWGPLPQEPQKSLNFCKFTRISGISGNSMIFTKFQEFCILRENGPRFAPTLKSIVIPMVFYRYFWSFSPESRFSAKRGKFRRIPEISPIFREFHKIWGISSNSGVLGANGPQINKIAHSGQLFKAETQAFREFWWVSAKLRNFMNFCGIPEFWRNSALFWSKPHLSGPRPPKHLPEPYAYKGFCAGGPKVHSGARKCIFGARNAKNGGFPPFFWKTTVTVTGKGVKIKEG